MTLTFDTPQESATRVEILKRVVDVAGASAGLALTLPLFPILALLIKLESPGPIFFRQLRIGTVRDDRTDLFEMIKFRSMREDAEKGTGAVWAAKNDPRITRIGKFLRKTRLDELPQFWNVIKGDMSLIGPRPERPGFYQKLERAIPYFAERTVGLRPGITGLAQVRQGYDETLDDVRNKVSFDHAYALRLATPVSWIKTDAMIVLETIKVMVFGRGR